MCTPGGAAATAKGMGTVRDGHSENCEGQVRRFGGFIAFFCLQCTQHCKQKKAINPPKRPTCPSQFSEGPSPMVPIPFAVAAAAPGVHIMPSLQPELPIGRSQHFKCHQSAAQRFSLYLLVHPVGRVKTSALLTDGISSVDICQWGVRLEVRALCVPQGAPQPLQNEWGPSGTGTRRNERDKFDTLAGLLPFFACSASGAPHRPNHACFQGRVDVFSGGPQRQARGETQMWLPHPCLLGGPQQRDKIKVGPKEGGNATSPLHSRGSPTPSAGRKSDVATSPLASRESPTKGKRSKWAQKRAKMLHHPRILGGPQCQAQGKNQMWLPHPCLLGGPQQRGQDHSGPKRGQRCYITPAFSGVPNAKRGEKIRCGYLTPAFSGVPNKGDKIKVGPKEGKDATSPPHSRGSPTPSAGRKSDVTTSPLPSRGSPTKGTRSKWAQKRAKMLHHPRILGGPQRQARGENQMWLPHPCLLWGPQQRGQNQSGPKRGQRCYITPAFSGVPNAKCGEKIRCGYLTRAFSGVPNKGDKIKVGPKEGKDATSPLHSRGSPTPSAGRKPDVATSPLPSRGSPNRWGQNQNWRNGCKRCGRRPRGAMFGRYAIKTNSILPKQGISGLRHSRIASSKLPSLGIVTLFNEPSTRTSNAAITRGRLTMRHAVFQPQQRSPKTPHPTGNFFNFGCFFFNLDTCPPSLLG